MLRDFFKKEKELITFTGIIAALSALFLNVALPENEGARTSLVDLQIFWLLLLVFCLFLLFISYIKSVFNKEKEIHEKYDVGIKGMFSLLIGYVFFWVIFSLLNYIINFQNTYPSQFLYMIESFGFLALLLWVTVLTEKYKNRIPSILGIVILSVLTTFSFIFVIASIQQLIYKSVSLFLFWPAPLISFIFIITVFVSASLYKKIHS